MNKAFLLSLISIFVALIAAESNHLDNLGFVIISIVTAYITGQAAERGTAIYSAAKDPAADTERVIENTLHYKQKDAK